MVDNREVYRKEIDGLVASQNRGLLICPSDGFSCCSICEDCGRRFCECGESSACERMLGRGCSATRGGDCPKGWLFVGAKGAKRLEQRF